MKRLALVIPALTATALALGWVNMNAEAHPTDSDAAQECKTVAAIWDLTSYGPALVPGTRVGTSPELALQRLIAGPVIPGAVSDATVEAVSGNSDGEQTYTVSNVASDELSAVVTLEGSDVRGWSASTVEVCK